MSSLVPYSNRSSELTWRDERDARRAVGEIRKQEMLALVRLLGAYEVALDGDERFGRLYDAMSGSFDDPIKFKFAMSALEEYRSIVIENMGIVGRPPIMQKIFGR